MSQLHIELIFIKNWFNTHHPGTEMHQCIISTLLVTFHTSSPWMLLPWQHRLFKFPLSSVPNIPFFSSSIYINKYPPNICFPRRRFITQTSAFTSSIHPPNIHIHNVNLSSPKHQLFMSLIHPQTSAFTLSIHAPNICISRCQSIPQTFAFHVINPSPIPTT